VLPSATLGLLASLLLSAQPAPALEVASTTLEVAGDAAPPLPQLEPVWLDLIVNSVNHGTLLVHLGQGDAWIADEDLARAKLVVGEADRIEKGGRSIVSLRSLSPDVSFEIDEAALAIRITAANTLLGRSRVDLASRRRPAGLVPREQVSGLFNWALHGDTGGARGARGEVGVAADRALFLTDGSIEDGRGFVRGMTTAFVDYPERTLRAAAGDIPVAPGDSLGGSALVLGATIHREFTLDPYAIRAPLPQTTIFAATPSTLEVWVNDSLIRTVPVAPGTVDLQNLPLIAGSNEVRTILRDSFGRESGVAVSQSMLGSSHLAVGLVDWGAYAGFRREEFGLESFEYGRPVAMARARAGVTPALTLGARVEGGDDRINAGGQAAVVNRYGEYGAAVAGSLTGAGAGGAADLSWRYVSRRMSGGVELRLASAEYANLSLDPGTDRPEAALRGYAAAAVASRVSIQGEAELDSWGREGFGGRVALRGFWEMARGVGSALFLSRSVQPGAEPTWEVYASLSVRLPDGGTATASGASGSSGERGLLTAQRPLGTGPGVGYRAIARAGEQSLASATVQAQAEYGRIEGSYEAANPFQESRAQLFSATAQGGLVFVGGKLFASLPVDESFAVVSVPGVKGVRAYLDGHEVGRTDSDGDLLVPGLTPYLANRLSIRDADVPLDHQVEEVQRFVAPRYRAGTVERFRITPLRVVTGSIYLSIDGASVPPEWGEVAVEIPGRRIVSPIGAGGLFWLEGLPPGWHEALVKWEGRLCRFSISVPVAAGVVEVGNLGCRQMLTPADRPGAPAEDVAEGPK
jgi:outer membrane usher protein